MGKRVVDDASLTAIADRIRAVAAPLRDLGEIAFPDGFSDGVEATYDAGFHEGRIRGQEDGFTSGEACGRQAEYDRFWDEYQNYGKPTSLGDAFSGAGWNANTFYPKYNIVSDAYALGGVFSMFNYISSTPFNLEERLLELGITMDFSKGFSPTNMFNYANISVVPELDFSHCSIDYLFNGANKTVTVRKLKVSEHTTYNNSFNSASALENITFEGVIGNSGLDLHWSTKLSRDSITNIVNHLSDSTTGMSVTFSRTAVNNAFSDAAWADLVAAKTNWTINLV